MLIVITDAFSFWNYFQLKTFSDKIISTVTQEDINVAEKNIKNINKKVQKNQNINTNIKKLDFSMKIGKKHLILENEEQKRKLNWLVCDALGKINTEYIGELRHFMHEDFGNKC